MHSWNALHLYAPQPFPALPLGFDLSATFREPPFAFLPHTAKAQTIYFSMVGVAFFLQSRVGFSLWATYLLVFGLWPVAAAPSLGTEAATIPIGVRVDQSFGAAYAFAAVLLWVGRAHWKLVLAQMLRGERDGEPAGRYLPYPVAGWGLSLCLAGMALFLTLAGMGLWPAVVFTLGAMLLLLVLARVVAETGLIFVQLIPGKFERLWVYQAAVLGKGGGVSLFSYFLTRFVAVFTIHDMRENLVVYATHALRVGDGVPAVRAGGRAVGLRLLLALALSLAVGYAVAAASTLYVNYNYAATLDAAARTPLDGTAVDDFVSYTFQDTQSYAADPAGRESQDRASHVAFGAGVVAALSFLRLRLTSWPLHPVGFLLVYTSALSQIWFSILLGWLAKALVVRLGGPPLMRGARPLFLGLIVGEAGTAAVWLVISLGLNLLGQPYHAVKLLPG